jgi:CRP/FNR family nitrogen fixation transcriptional regulator
VLAFLAQIQQRQRQTPDGFVSLPMSRNDIADYLGLSVETVSRAMTELKERRILEFDGTRQLKIARHSDGLLALPLHGTGNRLMTAA